MPSNKRATFTCAVASALVLILIPIHQIQGFPNGAPPTACATMIPGHGVGGQQSASPFATELLDGETVLMDGSVRLELRPQDGVRSFKGFLVMAFDKTDESTPIGTFKQPLDGKVMDCSGGLMNAVTHSNNLEKKTVTLDWSPPKNFMGQVVFRTTYVENKSTFWVKTESKAVAVVLEVAAVATTTTTVAPQTTSSTAMGASVSTTPMSDAATTSASTAHEEHAGDHDHPMSTVSPTQSGASQSNSIWLGVIALSLFTSLQR